MTQAEESPAMMQLLSAQKLFASVFQTDGVSSDHLKRDEYREMIDLSYCLQESDVTIPTLNG